MRCLIYVSLLLDTCCESTADTLLFVAPRQVASERQREKAKRAAAIRRAIVRWAVDSWSQLRRARDRAKEHQELMQMYQREEKRLEEQQKLLQEARDKNDVGSEKWQSAFNKVVGG